WTIDAEVHEIIKKMRSRKKLHREITDQTGGLFEVRINGVSPARKQAVPHGVRERHVKIGRAGNALKGSLRVEEILQEGAFQAPDAKTGAIVIGEPCGLGIFVLWHVGNARARTSPQS